MPFFSGLVKLARLLLPEMDMAAFTPSALTSRIIEPLVEPWTVLTGSAVTVSLADGETLLPLLRVAWRVLRLVLSL